MDNQARIDRLLKLWDKIHFFWHWYVGALLVLTGWAISTDTELDIRFKVLLSIMFGGFVAMNVSGLYRSYTLAEAARKDLENAPRNEGDSERLGNAACSLKFSYRLLCLAYIAGVIAAAWVIWGN